MFRKKNIAKQTLICKHFREKFFVTFSLLKTLKFLTFLELKNHRNFCTKTRFETVFPDARKHQSSSGVFGASENMCQQQMVIIL
jgi:hypothetical protein